MGDRSFGRLIRKRRESLGLSQARLGELVGRSSSTIRNWERDKSTPAARSDAVALAAVLGLDEAEVLDRAGFEVDGERTHQTVEEAYASLTPSSTVREDQDVRPETDEELDRESAPGEAEEPATGPTPETEAEELEVEAPAATPVSYTLPTISDPELEPAGITAPEPEDARADDPADEDAPRFELPSFWGRKSGAHLATKDPEERPRSETSEVAAEPAIPRAAPPTVLEAVGTGEPSYMEDPEERQRYRLRSILTAAVVVFLFLVFVWAFGRASDALSDMWNDFFSMLDL